MALAIWPVARMLTVALVEQFGLAWRPCRDDRAETDLLLVMQALVVIFQCWRALLLAAIVFSGRVDDIAGQQFLPEGEASPRTCPFRLFASASRRSY